MTIKIIEQGLKPSDRPMSGRCVRCNTKVECLKSDARTVSDRNETFNCVTCPICGNEFLYVK